MTKPCFGLASLVAWAALALPAAGEADMASLLDGVTEIAAPGVPGSLCVFGEQAFPVVTGKAGKFQEPVVAAARLAAGRVVAFGHDGYLGADALAAARCIVCPACSSSCKGRAFRPNR